jgi:glycopeptide antibiotics resistance protein
MFESLRTDFLWYWSDYLLRIPPYVFQMLVSVIGIGVVTLLAWKGFWRGIELAGRLLLLELVFIIYCLTIILRPVNNEDAYNFAPFWSYKAIIDGHPFLLAENMMNVLVFIPIGLLIGMGFSKWTWWKAIGVGCLISVSIELMQFTFRRGFCELDDVIHNTLGCTLGFVLFSIVRIGYRTLSKRHPLLQNCLRPE